MTIDRIDTPSPVQSYLQESRDQLVNDPAAEMAAIMLEHVRESREMSRTQRQHEEAHLRQMEGDRIEAMRDEADAIRTSGWYQGGSQIVAGGLKMGAAAYGGSNTSGYLEGGAKVSEGAGDVISKDYDAQAAEHRAEATACGNRAQAAERRLEDLREANADVRKLRTDALDHARQVVQTDAATAQAAVFQRA